MGRRKPSSKGMVIMNFEIGWLEEYRETKGGGIKVWVA